MKYYEDDISENISIVLTKKEDDDMLPMFQERIEEIMEEN